MGQMGFMGMGGMGMGGMGGTGWNPMGGKGGWPSMPPPQPLGDEPKGRGRDDSWRQQREEPEPAEEEPPEDVPVFLEPAIEEYVSVPKALLGKIIGKKAQTIIEIREKSGAYKVDARDQTSDPCQIKIAGTAEAIQKAKDLIWELLDSTKVKHTGEDYAEIPKSKIGMVIGLKGAQINEIQQGTNTKIDLDFDSDPVKVYIKGSPENIARAKKTVLTIAMQIEDDNSEYVDLPRVAAGALIGVAGTRIREFMEQSGARIDVDKSGTCCRVRLNGTPEQIANAKQFIFAEVENALNEPKPPTQHQNFETMTIPSHQPTSFPATLSESIARAKAAAEAVKSGLITSEPQDAWPAADSWGQDAFVPWDAAPAQPTHPPPQAKWAGPPSSGKGKGKGGKGGWSQDHVQDSWDQSSGAWSQTSWW